jgi:glycosyltransferase involved in cell wall biosynthesis
MVRIMRVLMLGWEFPPSINGGLGTACAGLVRALDDFGTEVIFITPKPAEHRPVAHAKPAFAPSRTPDPQFVELESRRIFHHVSFRHVPVQLNPYETVWQEIEERWETEELVRSLQPTPSSPVQAIAVSDEPITPPETGLFADVKQFTEHAERVADEENFDVIHAHDWMTFPAAMAIARKTGKPLVVHVHSTEHDRGGVYGNGRIAEIERQGVHAAWRVIAVSQFTKNMLVHNYGVPAQHVEVVYNAVEAPPQLRLAAEEFAIRRGVKLVLFMGRLTMQKGPEYFLTAARKVLEVMSDVKFIVAGDGDLARPTVELAARFGIAHKVLFTGFLRGLDVERIFQIADLFVMPSVSEPFGIAPLEAVARNVPTIISKTSGVSEVLKHALKVDFWDTNELANKIVAVLRHPTLANELRQRTKRDVAQLSWDAAAGECRRIYNELLAARA